MTYFTYIIKNLINNKIYIGKTGDLEERWKKHLSISLNPNSVNYFAIHKAIHKYGKENFTINKISEYETEDEALIDEISLIKIYDSTNKKIGYNLTVGGDGCSRNCSEQTKDKISKANRGKVLSQETKNKISSSNLGKIRTIESKIKYSNAKKNNIVSEETKNKISEKIKLLWENEDYRRNISNSLIGKKQDKNTIIKRSGENNKRSKLKKIQVLEIIEKYSTGNYTHRSLGLEYNVSHRQIGYILSNKSWKDIKE